MFKSSHNSTCNINMFFSHIITSILKPIISTDKISTKPQQQQDTVLQGSNDNRIPLLFTVQFLSHLFRVLGRRSSEKNSCFRGQKFTDKMDHSGDYSHVRNADA